MNTFASEATPMPESMARRTWLTLHLHADDPATGLCRVDQRPNCEQFRGARADLVIYGLAEWDPIQEAYREQAPRDRTWIHSLGDQ